MTTIPFDLETPVGEVVAAFPKSAEVFKKHGIDFCCGGQNPLGDAIEKSGAEREIVFGELEELYDQSLKLEEKDVDWRKKTTGSLIDYIVNKHHAYLNKRIPELASLVNATLRAHGAAHNELSIVHRLFNTLRGDLEQHLITEEEVLFPLLKEFGDGDNRALPGEVYRTVGQLEKEHHNSGDILKELRDVTADYAIPLDACPTYKRTYALLEELEADLFRHIHLENNILHPRLR